MDDRGAAIIGWRTSAPLRRQGPRRRKEIPMTDRKTDPTHPNVTGNTAKDPEDWTTGDEPMTGAQHSYLKTLCA